MKHASAYVLGFLLLSIVFFADPNTQVVKPNKRELWKKNLALILRDKGEVVWEKSDMDFPKAEQVKKEDILPAAQAKMTFPAVNLFHFIETKDGIIIFYERGTNKAEVIGTLSKIDPRRIEYRAHLHDRQLKFLRYFVVLISLTPNPTEKQLQQSLFLTDEQTAALDDWKFGLGKISKASLLGLMVLLAIGSLSATRARWAEGQKIVQLGLCNTRRRLTARRVRERVEAEAPTIVIEDPIARKEKEAAEYERCVLCIQGLRNDAQDQKTQTALQIILADLEHDRLIEGIRPSKAVHALTTAFSLVQHSEDEFPELDQAEELEETLAGNGVGLSSPRVNVDLLPIDDLIPESLNEVCVKNIIRCLLRPGGQNPYFGEHHISRGKLQKRVQVRGFPKEEFDECFEWLVKIGVISYAPQSGSDDLCSLTRKFDQKVEAARQILETACRAKLTLFSSK